METPVTKPKRKTGAVVGVNPLTFKAVYYWSSAADASRALGVSKEAIRRALYKGFHVKNLLIFYTEAYKALVK